MVRNFSGVRPSLVDKMLAQNNNRCISPRENPREAEKEEKAIKTLSDQFGELDSPKLKKKRLAPNPPKIDEVLHRLQKVSAQLEQAHQLPTAPLMNPLNTQGLPSSPPPLYTPSPPSSNSSLDAATEAVNNAMSKLTLSAKRTHMY